ncbi:mucin-5AC [Drosophila santomea]|uniref:mucin-5AC n=1 Tax=Drosophila santomea TaxID=129105 RepID=UPI0019531509|nr:mucin-5AC [Drosophila santomea]
MALPRATCCQNSCDKPLESHYKALDAIHGGHKPLEIQTELKVSDSRAFTMILILLQVLAILGHGVVAQKSSPIANWHMGDPHYTSDQYAKILGEAGLDQDADDKEHKGLGPMQIQYVDYQPNCQPGGVPVCATNGTDSFYFENNCRLEAANMKMLFQHGTELEPTEMERCLPTCQTMKCTQVARPVCALAEIAGAVPQTFANECEMRRRECHTKQVLRILHTGPCQTPTKSGHKKKLRRNKKKRPLNNASISKFATIPKKVYVMLATPAPRRSSTTPRWTAVTTTTTRITTTPRMRPTKQTSTSPSPMQFQQLMNLANPMVSVSQAVDAYNVYNIPDVGHDYGEITDSSLSMFLPEVGRVTEPHPMPSRTTSTTSTSTTTSTTTTTTPKPVLAATRIINPLGTSTVQSFLSVRMPSTTEMGEETTMENSEAITQAMSTTQKSTAVVQTKVL